MKRLVEIDDATHAVVPRKVTSEIVRAWNGGDPDSSLPASAAVECQADWDRMLAAAPTLHDAQAVADESIAEFLAEPFELNYSNYDFADVEQLQDWALRAHDIIKARAALSAAHVPGCGDGEDCSACDVLNAAPRSALFASAGDDKQIAGALFDFLGYLTGRETSVTFSARDDASPAVEALKKWAAMRGLSLDEANVRGWNTAIAAASKGAGHE